MTLFDFGATSNVMSSSLCTQLPLNPQDFRRQITMVGYKEAVVMGEVHLVPAAVGPVTIELSCLVAH